MKKIFILLLLASCQKETVKLNQDLTVGYWKCDSIQGDFTQYHDNLYYDFSNDTCTMLIDSMNYQSKFLYYWQDDSILSIGNTSYKVETLTDSKFILNDNGTKLYLSK